MSERSRAFGRRAAGELGNQATRALAASALILTVLAGMWMIEGIDYVLGGQLQQYGIRAHHVGDLWQIFTAPFMHGSFQHLMANSIPFAVLGFLAALRGLGKFAVMSLMVMVVGGLGVWFTGPPDSETLGASILVFGFFGYLLGRGVFERHLGDLLIAGLVLVLYGGIVYGVIPTNQRISWQGHLFGMIGGFLAAYLLRRRRAAAL